MKIINYPHKAGALYGFVNSLSFGRIPGVEITDTKAFEDWIQENLLRIEKDSTEEVSE